MCVLKVSRTDRRRRRRKAIRRQSRIHTEDQSAVLQQPCRRLKTLSHIHT